MIRIKKARLIRTQIIEYDIIPEYYPEEISDAEIACLDVRADGAEFGVFSGECWNNDRKC